MRNDTRNSHNEIFLNKLSEAAADNAVSLLSDARVLREKRSFGHAFSLAVLAEEELGKATFLWLAALDKSAVLTADRKLVIAGRRYEPFSSHPSKQSIQLGWALFAGLFRPIFERVRPLLDQESLDLDAAVRIVNEYVTNLTKNSERWLETLEPIIELGGLEREKQLGFYVDYEKSKVLLPSDFQEERCEQVIDRVSREFETTRKYLGRALPQGLEGIFLTSQNIFGRTDYFEFVKRWRAGKIPPSRIEEETSKMRRKILTALRKSFDC